MLVRRRDGFYAGAHPGADDVLVRRRDDFYAGAHPGADDVLLIEVSDTEPTTEG